VSAEQMRMVARAYFDAARRVEGIVRGKSPVSSLHA
jgi:hypothetical protein